MISHEMITQDNTGRPDQRREADTSQAPARAGGGTDPATAAAAPRKVGAAAGAEAGAGGDAGLLIQITTLTTVIASALLCVALMASKCYDSRAWAAPLE